MNIRNCQFRLAAGVLAGSLVTFPASAQFYRQTNLVSDLSTVGAQVQDPMLVNPWGVSHGPTTPFWVSDAGKFVSTLYSVNPATGVAAKVGLTVSIGPPATPAPPSGQLFNGTSDFVVTDGTNTGPALFLFAGLNGKLYGWNPGVPPTTPPPSKVAQPAATGTNPAAYTGIAVGTSSGVQYLYAANPAGNRIDVYDGTFTNVSTTTFAGKFVDPSVIAGLVPFNIANINGQLFVSYAAMNPAQVALGMIDVFDTAGNLVSHFAIGSPSIPIYNPWGMVIAPPDFGKFASALLVGNFNLGNGAAAPPNGGPGYISAFSLEQGPHFGEFLGLLQGTNGGPLQIDGLWQLIPGNGAGAGNPSDIYFSAGIEGQHHGLFGSLTTCGGPIISNATASPNVLWPPNNKFVNVSIGYSTTDNCDAAPVCSLSVTATDSGGGINNTADSSIVVDAHDVELLASRNGGGDGRVYDIAITCKDKLPLSSTAHVTVTVPHDQGHGK